MQVCHQSCHRSLLASSTAASSACPPATASATARARCTSFCGVPAPGSPKPTSTLRTYMKSAQHATASCSGATAVIAGNVSALDQTVSHNITGLRSTPQHTKGMVSTQVSALLSTAAQHSGTAWLQSTTACMLQAENPLQIPRKHH